MLAGAPRARGALPPHISTSSTDELFVPRPPSLLRGGGGGAPAFSFYCGGAPAFSLYSSRRASPLVPRSYREGGGDDGGFGGGDGGFGGGDANSNNNGGGSADSRHEAAAIRQAVQILREARAMADSQTRAELQQAWAADRAWSAQQREAEDEPPPRDGRAAPTPAPTPETHAAFFEEAGLRAYDARLLARDLRRDVPALASRPLRDLAAALAVLARAVPGVPPAELALRDARILAVPAELVVGCMVALVAAFPGRDAGELVLRCPRLVLATAEALAENGASSAAAAAAADGAAAAALLSSQVRAAMRTLVRLHPSHDYNVVAAAVCQGDPGVLLRMSRYEGARMLDELPLEVQTVFVEADRGIGWLHKHWRRVRKEEAAADEARRRADQEGGAGPGAGVPLADWRSLVAGGQQAAAGGGGGGGGGGGALFPPPPLPVESPQSTLELDGPGSSPFDSPHSTTDGS